MVVRPLRWADGGIELLDQTLLPQKVEYRRIESPQELATWIKELRVRGAPLIGVAAAFGCALAGIHSKATTHKHFAKDVAEAASLLASTRPTAVNLFWAIGRMEKVLRHHLDADTERLKSLLLREALSIQTEDEETCRKIGEYGAALLRDGMRVLTHCNAGTLATSYWGTALGVLYSAREEGKRIDVWATETRPLLQGARLTVWELRQAGYDPTLITDSSAAWIIRQEKIDCVLVGADRIALNGDVANKVGTYSLSIAAKDHGVPMYVAAPMNTVDPATDSGDRITIEMRSPSEVTSFGGHAIAPLKTKAVNYAFDVTPAANVTAIITEKGVFSFPYRGKLGTRAQ